MYFVTGGTGFVGKYVVDQLLKHQGKIYLLILESHKERFEVLLHRRWEKYRARIEPIYGDVTKSDLGIQPERLKELKGQVEQFYHLASLDALKASQKACQTVNANGTQNAVDVANQLGSSFHYLSTIAISGKYEGVFKEEMLEEGQEPMGPYASTKYEAELKIHKSCKVPFRIYRPGIIVGCTETGEAEKIEGPYYLFKLIQTIGKILPQWFPLLGLEGGKWYLTPVNYVAQALVHIAHKKELDDKTFHLVGDAVKVGDVINEFCRVAHAPQLKTQISNETLASLPLELIKKIPFSGLLGQQALSRLEYPDTFMDLLTWETEFEHTNTTKALKGSKIVCPPLQDYARIIWYFWEGHMEPILTETRSSDSMTQALRATTDVITRGRSLSEVVKDQWELATRGGRQYLERVIAGRMVLITGGSSGIGLAIAHRLARAKGTVILVARSLDKLEIARKEVEQLGGKAFIYSCDLSNPEAIGELVEQIKKEHGGVDILINNAGRSIRRPIDQSYDRFHDFERTMDLNYFGCLKLILGFLPRMREQQFGHIINISSIGCQTNVPRFSAYVASKSALDAFSKSISSEVAHDNVTLTTVYMPLVRTPMISPTKMYDNVPTLTPEQAAKLAITPLITQKRKVSTPLGTFAEVLHSLSPKTANIALNLGFRLFPDSDPTEKEGKHLSPEAVAFAYLSKGIHW
ncbi:SDR family NAD(P)-dependent oxidoreductase [Deltaproteobacteria bacterium TL4]